MLVQVWSVLVFQLVLNLAETFVAIFIGTNIFLFHPTVSIIICLNVLLVEFELMALCALFSIQLNCNTVVRSRTPLTVLVGNESRITTWCWGCAQCIFIMNFGLVFDYSAHISHMFMTTGGTNRQRAAVRSQRFRCAHSRSPSLSTGKFSSVAWAPASCSLCGMCSRASLFRRAGVGL